ncbi:hypothetical protein P5719_006185 [Lactobacillus amylovorus]|jgi:uncharacterized membrane protein YuzA (DUF378 family)|uniref:hypothetical protein n=1 Tax=Lactobacillus amylovorus TaxID=1604 RepID=UPI00313B564E|nr:hypothetical protein [Lactobacillus amylovorus]
MKRKILKVLFICFMLFLAIDSFLWIAFGFHSVDTVLKLFGITAGINVVPKWIIIVVGIAMLIFVIKYDAIFDYLFESRDQRKD